MMTIALLAGILSVPSTPVSQNVVATDLAGNDHVLFAGRRTHLATPEGQVRVFGEDGSITVYEVDGKVWKL